MSDFQRVLPLQGIHNFRDYGGYAADGGRIRTGVLWRSGQHAKATPEDLDKVHDLEIRTVIDLRGDSEREKFPCLRHEEFAGDVLFHPGETAGRSGKAVHEEFGQITTAAEAHLAMNNLYKTMAWRPVLVGTYKLYFEALAERDGASLLHCLAGKDRTGVAAALVHSLMGVHWDDIASDYLLTNTAGNPEARIAASADHIRANYGKDIEPDAIRTVMNVHEDYLNTAFAAIRDRHGSVQAYAEEILGVTPERLEKIRERLIN